MATPTLAPSHYQLAQVGLQILVDEGCATLTSPALRNASMATLGALSGLKHVSAVQPLSATVLRVAFNQDTSWTLLRQTILNALWPSEYFQVILTEETIPFRTRGTGHIFAIRDVDGRRITLVAPGGTTDTTSEAIAREIRRLWQVSLCCPYIENTGHRQGVTAFAIEFRAPITWHTPGIREVVLGALKSAAANERVRLVHS